MQSLKWLLKLPGRTISRIFFPPINWPLTGEAKELIDEAERTRCFK